jgi:hypothetical protein
VRQRAIFERPLADLSWSDFESVISTGFEEDQTLEFEETLPACVAATKRSLEATMMKSISIVR